MLLFMVFNALRILGQGLIRQASKQRHIEHPEG